MAQKLRRMVMKRAALCDKVAGAARIQGPGVGVRVGEILSPILRDGEVLPDPGLTIQLYGRKLQGFRDTMVATDSEHLKQRAVLADLFREGEAPTGKLKGSILSLRSTCEGLLGKDSLRSLGLDFNLAQEPQGVLRQGEIIRERLLSSESELNPARWVRSPLARQELADELDGEVDELRLFVQRLVEQRKLVDTAKVRKDQAIEEFDRQFIPIARLLESTFRVAGETELADRIRPTVRQLGRDDGQEQEGGEPEAVQPEAEQPVAVQPAAVPPGAEPRSESEAGGESANAAS